MDADRRQVVPHRRSPGWAGFRALKTWRHSSTSQTAPLRYRHRLACTPAAAYQASALGTPGRTVRPLRPEQPRWPAGDHRLRWTASHKQTDHGNSGSTHLHPRAVRGCTQRLQPSSGQAQTARRGPPTRTTIARRADIKHSVLHRLHAIFRQRIGGGALAAGFRCFHADRFDPRQWALVLVRILRHWCYRRPPR